MGRMRSAQGNWLNLLLFSTVSQRTGRRLDKILGYPSQKTEICRTISSLSSRLCQPKYDLDVAVFVAASKDELDGLLSINNLIDDLPIILVLPDQDCTTVSRGHVLRPRFLTYLDSDFSDILAVLKKMGANKRYCTGPNVRDGRCAQDLGVCFDPCSGRR